MSQSVIFSGAALSQPQHKKSIFVRLFGSPTRTALLMILLLSLIRTGRAQNYDPTGGFPSFVSTMQGQFDTLNLPYGNVHFDFPVRAKAGKYPITFSLGGNSHLYVGPPSISNYFYGYWTASYGVFGYMSGSQFSSSAAGVNFTGSSTDCGSGIETTYTNFTVVDSNATHHPIQPGVQ
ncbi:MAG TPA: hypothetical protein VI386_08250, partial [Candidatus Sulfotelmatobacter sp.]